MFSHFELFMLFVGCFGRNSPVLTRIYLFAHCFLAQKHHEILQAYSVKQALLRPNNRQENRARNARMKKVDILSSLNGDSGKTNFYLLLESYVNFTDWWWWDLIIPDDAKDNYAQHEPDFNEWRWGSATTARN